MIFRCIAIKEEAKNVLIKKDTSKVKNTLLQLVLQDILENKSFQRIAMFIMVDFFKMDFPKGIVMLVKVDEMCNILKYATGV